MDHQFERAALSIAKTLCEQAVHTNFRATWLVRQPRVDGPVVPADGRVYGGASGVALFLSELFARTSVDRLRIVSEAAVRHSLEWAEATAPTNIGFFDGVVGVAYVAARAGDLLNVSEFRERAAELIHRCVGSERSGSSLDVISGQAGAIPALLALSERPGLSFARLVAIEMGEHLLSCADRLPNGWSWGRSESCSRGLTGLAHGASGFSRALFELATSTGRESFKYAAIQSVCYENDYYSSRWRNWTDFRQLAALAELLPRGRREELRTRIRAGERFDAKPDRYMEAWCHGAPGIGLARLRSFELFPDPQLRTDIDRALPSTERSVGAGGNYSLCHGIVGNCETLLMAADRLGIPRLRGLVEGVLADGIERFQERGIPWPCGTVYDSHDPSLMLGAAGVGHGLLRATDARIPSILMVSPPCAMASARLTEHADDYHRLFREDALRHAKKCHAALPPSIDYSPPLPGSLSVNQVGQPALRLMRMLSANHARTGAELAFCHAVRVDCAAMELLTSALNFTADFLEEIALPERSEWPQAVWRLSHRVRLVESRESTDAEQKTVHSEVMRSVVVREGADTRVESMTSFAFLVLTKLGSGRTHSEVQREVEFATSMPTNEPRLSGAVRAQLDAAVEAGLLQVVWQSNNDLRPPTAWPPSI